VIELAIGKKLDEIKLQAIPKCHALRAWSITIFNKPPAILFARHRKRSSRSDTIVRNADGIDKRINTRERA